MPDTSLLRDTLTALDFAGRYAGYRPHFRAEEFQPGIWWILDGETRVGMVHGEAHTLELVNFFPDTPRAVEFPAIYHAPTAPGDRITLAHWIEWAQATTSERHQLTFSSGGQTLRVGFEEWFADGAHALKTCTFVVDPDLGYAVQVNCRVESPVAHQIEFANFLPQNVVDDRPGHIRYPFILWQHPDGRLLRWNQNNAGAGCYGNRDHHGSRQISPEGFLGYFGEADHCPVAEFHGANMPISAATCHNMLDEHLHWVVPRDLPPPQDEEGRYRYQASFTLASLPGGVGQALSQQARLNDLILHRYPTEMTGRYPWTREATGPVRPMRHVVFRQQCLCDFTERLDPAASDRSQIFLYPENDDNAAVSLVSTGGRRTDPCLRLQSAGGKVTAGPEHGCSLHLTAGARYRVSAWLKTALTSGDARLRVWEWMYRPGNLTREYLSAPVAGHSDWTPVQIEFTPSGERVHCMSLEAVLEGAGQAWLDELLIEVTQP